MKTDNPAGRTPAKPLNEEVLQRMLQARTRLAAETRLHKELGEQYRHYMRLAALRHYAASCCAIALVLGALWGVIPEARAAATSHCSHEQRQTALDVSEKIIHAL